MTHLLTQLGRRAAWSLSAALLLTGCLSGQEPFQVKVSGHGRPMILIPGLSSAGETWDSTVAHYQDRFECHVLTLAGFAGQPRVAGPLMDAERDAIAAYIRKRKLDRPVVVGHSLGGMLALNLAAREPNLIGPLVIVDAYPFLAGLSNPAATPESAQAMGAQLRTYIGASQASYDAYVKSGVGTRSLVEKESDAQRLVAWGLASDRTAVADWMAELYSLDQRDDVAKIKSPTLVMGSFAGYEAQGATQAGIEKSLRTQYAKLAGIEILVSAKAHHFIMWDDPEWMFAQIDRFLRVKP
jgi:N-formylmaleamate deformylase